MNKKNMNDQKLFKKNHTEIVDTKKIIIKLQNP